MTDTDTDPQRYEVIKYRFDPIKRRPVVDHTETVYDEDAGLKRVSWARYCGVDAVLKTPDELTDDDRDAIRTRLRRSLDDANTALNAGRISRRSYADIVAELNRQGYAIDWRVVTALLDEASK